MSAQRRTRIARSIFSWGGAAAPSIEKSSPASATVVGPASVATGIGGAVEARAGEGVAGSLVQALTAIATTAHAGPRSIARSYHDARVLDSSQVRVGFESI